MSFRFRHSLCLMPRSLLELPQRGWPLQKSLHLSLFRHSLLVKASSPLPSVPLPVPFSFMFFCTLSFYLLIGQPLQSRLSVSPKYNFFSNSLPSILCVVRKHQNIPFCSFCYIILHSTCTYSHATAFMHTINALTSPYCHSMWSSWVIHCYRIYF